MAEGEVRIRYVADRSQFDAEIKAMQATSDATVKAMGSQAKAAGDTLAAGVTAATAKITDAERKLAAEIKAADTALRARAKALDLTTGQLSRLDRAMATSATATTKLADTTGNARAASANLNAQIFDIGQQLSAGTNPFVILTQQGPQVAQALAGADDAVGVLKTSLMQMTAIVAPIAGIVAAGYVAWRIYAEDSERAAETATKVKAALDAMRPAMDATTDATIRLRVATGDLTEQEGALLTAATQAHRAYQTATAETRAEVAALHKQQSGIKTQLVDAAEAFLDVVDVAGLNSLVFDALTTSGEELQEQIDAVTGAQGAQIDILRTQVKTTKDAIVADGKRKTSMEALSAATKELEERNKRLAEAARKAMEAQIDRLASLLGLVVEAERAFAAEAEAADLAAQATAGAVSRAALAQWGALSAAVDEAIPADALSRADQLRLLLLDLELAAAKSGEAASALASDLERVRSAIATEDAARGMAMVAEQTAQARDAAREFLGVLERVGTAAQGVASSIVGLVDSLTGGALSSLLSGDGLIATAGTEGEGGGAAEAAVDAALAFVDQVIAELPRVLSAVADGIPKLIAAVTAALPEVVQALIDELPTLVDGLAETIPALLVELATQIPILVTAIVEQLPTLVTALVQAIPTIIRALVAGLPDLFDAIFAAIPEIIIAVVDAIPDIVMALVEAVPVIVTSLISAIVTELLPRLPEIALALAKALIVTGVNVVLSMAEQFVSFLVEDIPVFIEGLIKELPTVVKELAAAGAEFAAQVIAGLGRFFSDLIKEIGSLGTKKTETFGDTPGPIKVGVEGMTARFAAGDVVVAARTRQAARQQLGPEPTARAPIAAASTSPPPRLDISDGHVLLDGLFRRNIASGGTLSSLRHSPAHVEVYRR